MKKILFAALMFCTLVVFAQKAPEKVYNESTNLIHAKYFHDDGSIRQIGTFTKEGKLQGEWITYNKEGEKTALAKYDNGNRVGKWFFWDGDKMKEVDYDNNKIINVTEWKNGSKVANN
ncbi:toxin-antitoxin system YwqK family antitoxin [Aegicerativicinus sediminis]|uniref:toxin-antitoxin system YwqK family antitoxin n=1 Tax=Aegicerativicinus sediminis TaxID=2893202 RepID=UPI001E31A11B|nr:nicotinic acid mononucleotide adenyltransferase [Aegicerativicinus sediminis]